MQTTSESASIVIAELSRARTPRPAKTVSGPEEQRDRRRDDRAEDEQEDEDQQRRRQQLGPLGGAERFLLQGARDASRSPTGSPRTGARTLPLERAFQRRHGVAHRRRRRHVEVDQDQGLARRRAQAATEPRSQGEITVAAGSWRSAADQPGPWRSIAAAGPRSRTAKGEESPKWLLGQLFAFAARVPGILSESGASLPSTPQAEHAEQRRRTSRTAARPTRGRR